MRTSQRRASNSLEGNTLWCARGRNQSGVRVTWDGVASQWNGSIPSVALGNREKRPTSMPTYERQVTNIA